MKYRVHLGRLPGGSFTATCLEPQCTARGQTREEAVETIRREIRYRLELCPCTTVSDDHVELEILAAGD